MAENQSTPARAGRPRQRAQPIGIKSIDQALDVVDALARADRPRSLTELAGDTGMKASNLHRYLVSLCARGFAKQVEQSGHYTLGPRALSLGLVALSRIDEFEVAREATDELRETLGESAFCYVWSPAGPVLVCVRRPPYALISPRLGSIISLLHSATGPIFLTYMPEHLTGPILARDAADRGLTLADAEMAGAHLAKAIRKDGLHWSDTTIMPDSAACAAPVFNTQGDLFAVVGVSFYLHGAAQPPQQRIMETVSRICRSASNRLGYFP